MSKEDRLSELKDEFENIKVPEKIDFKLEEAIKRGKMHKRIKNSLNISLVSACAALILFTFCFGGFKRIETPINKNIEIASKDSLPHINSSKNLELLLSNFEMLPQAVQQGMKGAIYNGASQTKDINQAAVDGSAAVKSHSDTNVQVEGVDEDDTVKTDGKYIYKLSGDKVVIVDASGNGMKIAGRIYIESSNQAQGIYVYGKYVAVIASLYDKEESTVKTAIYDVSDMSDIREINKFQISGSYVSSRMLEGKIYMVLNQDINLNELKAGREVRPYYIDQRTNIKSYVGLDKVSYMPDAVEPNFINIGIVDLNKGGAGSLVSFMGSGRNIYMSQENLYVAGTKWSKEQNGGMTEIYKFGIGAGAVKYSGKAEVSGTVLNQFSMDEYNGCFRIATTEGGMPYIIYNKLWINKTARDGLKAIQTPKKMTNDLYVIDKNMAVKGSIKNIAPDEKIYSVRFMGDRAYMVTYKQMDPLFVIDLKDAANPKILGELKIPGFSTYLHPYDENHLIGFGYDSTLVNEGGSQMARTQGMKAALFDVTDVNNPIQKYIISIGKRGTNSDLLQDHKALLFSKENGIIAFPVDEVDSEECPVSFQGAYVYHFDLQSGFVLKGRITHIKDQTELQKDYYNDRITRIIYIGDKLFTISNDYIKENDMNSLKDISTIDIR
jgi:inhibitor of cysteine peptidase